MSVFVLVHSPLVGPSTWHWVAEELRNCGHTVTVAAVPQAVTRQGWQAFADCVAAQASHASQCVLVGHSGAGPLLPQIAQRARCTTDAMVFVDAGLPPDSGAAELVPAAMLADLQALAVDGILPPWSQWWEPDVMAELIPDADRRTIVTSELPRLPVSYFEDQVPVPASWSATRSGYVLLSEAYAADAARAAGRGWPVVSERGAHLDLVTRPAEIATAILTVTQAATDCKPC